MPTPQLPPFTIAVDTREQNGHAYAFEGLVTERKKLDAGDYSIVGYEQRVSVERKTKLDMWQCCCGERGRFVRALQRLSEVDSPLVVIECSLEEFIQRPERIRNCNVASAVGGILSWQCQYRVPFWWAGSRELAERTAVRHLASWWKHKRGG